MLLVGVYRGVVSIKFVAISFLSMGWCTQLWLKIFDFFLWVNPLGGGVGVPPPTSKRVTTAQGPNGVTASPKICRLCGFLIWVNGFSFQRCFTRCFQYWK